MNEVYLLLGSNDGIRNKNMEDARILITATCGPVIKASSIYQTEAWGVKGQPAFLNQAILIKTALLPQQLLSTLKQIEKQVGRVETFKWGPRVIDIDILFYGTEIIDLPELKIPHPGIQQRRFTLIPLNEIAPHLQHPVLNQTISVLLTQCPDNCSVKRQA